MLVVKDAVKKLISTQNDSSNCRCLSDSLRDDQFYGSTGMDLEHYFFGSFSKHRCPELFEFLSNASIYYSYTD